VKTSTVDPDGLALATQVAYEAPGAGRFMRPVSTTTPANTTTTVAYYGPTETRANPCGGGAAANQGGRARTTTDPDPDGPGPALARVGESVYDAAGRVVASRLGADAWTCVTYDARGRVATRVLPAPSPRTLRYNYAVGSNPLVTSVSDPAGTITTTTDVLGRVVAYSDAWAKTTTSAYDQAGRVMRTDGPGGRRDTSYDAAGRPTAQYLGDAGAVAPGPVVATPTYNGAGELASATYANGSALAAIARNPAGATTGLTWTAAGQAPLATDAVVRSQSGRVVDETIDGVDVHAGANFAYDGAGRLTAAWVPRHTLTYAFASTGGCGFQANAGRNSNRSAVTDNAVTTTSCYDAADRLTSANDPAVGTPGYDAHGNTTTLGPQAMTYDGADRHVKTTAGPTTVAYVRDATDRIISRTEATTTTRYLHSGPGDSPVATATTTGAVTQRSVGLVGGVLVAKRSSGDIWSYPNVHGDVMAVAGATGAKVGLTRSYDPYGKALAVLPDNSPANFDYGWLGQHQRPTEHA
ncbi:MAG: hypothetical protein LC708_02840, partial [Actinobacteria bacterium]|nr:hypothetical protein [Actinomycetota bacterium]